MQYSLLHYYAEVMPQTNLNKANDKYGHIKYACVTNRALVVICRTESSTVTSQLT